MNQLFGPSIPKYADISSISSDWTISQTDVYSWVKIWDLDTSVDFRNHNIIFTGGANGTVIAKHEQLYQKNCYVNTVTIHDMKFNQLHKYVVSVPCEKLFFYVTQSDKLIVLTNRGKLFEFFAGYEKSSCFLTNKEVIAASFWGNGLVFLTKSELYVSYNFSRPKKIKDLPNDYTFVSELKVIPPEYTDDGFPIVFMTDYSTQLTVITKDDFFQVEIGNDESIEGFAFSQDFSLVAFMCTNNTLIVTTISLDKTLLRLAIEDVGEFVQISWLGNHSPVIAFVDDIATFVTAENDNHSRTDFGDLIIMDQLKYSFSGRTHLFTSDDCILVLSEDSLFKISHVSDELRRASVKYPIFPVSRLIDAFDKRSSEKILKLKEENNLDIAIKESIKVASEVDLPEQQRILLLAAAYGRSYSSTSNRDTSEMAKIVETLRICNTFRTELNIIFTPYQRNSSCTTTRDILMRCCNRHSFSLAMEMADYLYTDKTPILTEWCCTVSEKVKNDETAFRIYQAKKNENFDSNSIAFALRGLGRQNLALKIADNEKSPSRVIPFYISCGLWKEAFDAAARSSDSSLFIEVLNKALKAGCSEELVSDAISHDLVSALTIAKLSCGRNDTKIGQMLQNAPLSPSTIEIVVRRYLREKILTTKSFEEFLIVKANVKKMISNKINAPWINSIYFALKHNLHILRAEDVLVREKGDRGFLFKTFNIVFDRLILSRDMTTAMRIVKETQSNEKRYMVRIGNVYASHNKVTDFMELTDISYKDYWNQYVLIGYFKLGKPITEEFVKNIKNVKKSTELLALLNQDDFPGCLLHAKTSLKIFTDKFF